MADPLRVYWWNEQPNFGDAMNPLLLERLFGRTVVWASLQEAELTAAGSVIQWITPVLDAREQPIAIWGSGYIHGVEPPPPHDAVRFCAVRGRMSIALSALPADTVCGDPGILASLVVPRPQPWRRRIGVVPHLWHRDHPTIRGLAHVDDVVVIDVSAEPLAVIEQIASCELVLSTSLHGLVIADSYRIPNRWVTLEPPLFGGRWKFDDYYSGWARHGDPVPLRATSAADLRALIGDSEHPPEAAGLEAAQDRLLAAFPFSAT